MAKDAGSEWPSPTVDRSTRPVHEAALVAQLPALRRDGDREIPVGPRAERTRAALLQAAYDLFVSQGFHGTPVSDIAARAGVSLGTFYQYFRDRSDVVAALVRIGVRTFLERTEANWSAAGGRRGLHDVIFAFVTAYVERAEFNRMWDEVCHFEPELAELRRDLSRLLTEMVERELIDGGRAGHCRRFTAAEAKLTARALASMVDRFCYVTYAFDTPAGDAPSPEQAADVLTELWAGAIGLRT